jgi:hypothetical protein
MGSQSRLELPEELWALVLSFVVRRNPTSGLFEHTALLHLATASKADRVRVIRFWNTSLRVTSEIEAIVSDPERVFDTRYGWLPHIGILRPNRVEDLPSAHLRRPEWSLLHADSACVRASSAADIALITCAAATVIFTTPTVSFDSLVLHSRLKCLIIDRIDRITRSTDSEALVSGSIRCHGVTHFAISPNTGQLPSLACIQIPNVQHMLIGSALASMDGIEGLTRLRSLAIKGPGRSPAVLQSIGRIAALAQLTTLYIRFTSHEVYLKFTYDALPSLTNLVALTVCTVRAAQDLFLHHAREAHACLTGLESLSLLSSKIHPCPWPTLSAQRPARPMHLDMPRLTKLGIDGAWYSEWRSCEGLTAVTDLALSRICGVVHATETETDPVTSLATLGLANMHRLASLKLNNLYDLQTLNGLNGLRSSITRLLLTRCSNLTDIGIIGSMSSLIELSVFACGHVRMPSMVELTRLTILSIDLRDTDSDSDEEEPGKDEFRGYTKFPVIPKSLRRLRFMGIHTADPDPRTVKYIGSIASRNPLLLELSVCSNIISRDKVWFYKGMY